ncbi:unnamed protein product [Allacma fusca]|uniref:Uncharacterized protein n=1 Tax=Allacma fusca TaxID=39272 RepID=A0A8J2K2G3_9HEXA|nr:unnamed protein product [Allacma fusca]
MEEPGRRRTICCIDTGTWTWFIGWYQVVGSLLPIILLAMLLDQYMAEYHLMSTTVLTSEKNMSGDSYCQNLTLATVIATLQLILMMLNFVMGFFLLWGFYNRNPEHIQIWTDFTVIFVFVWELMSLAQYSVNTCGTGEVTPQFVGLIVSVAIQGLSVGIVSIYKKELLQAADQPLLQTPIQNYRT